MKIQPIIPTTTSEVWEQAEKYYSIDMVKSQTKSVGDVFFIINLGLDLGLSPPQAIQNISIIRGRATVWGDLMLALVYKSEQLAIHSETITGSLETGDAACVCKIQRTGFHEATYTFSTADAKRAGLWKYGTTDYKLKRTPWAAYPLRMLTMRARTFALRDAFPDILKGLTSREEAMDIPKKEVKPLKKEKELKNVSYRSRGKSEKENSKSESNSTRSTNGSSERQPSSEKRVLEKTVDGGRNNKSSGQCQNESDRICSRPTNGSEKTTRSSGDISRTEMAEIPSDESQNARRCENVCNEPDVKISSKTETIDPNSESTTRSNEKATTKQIVSSNTELQNGESEHRGLSEKAVPEHEQQYQTKPMTVISSLVLEERFILVGKEAHFESGVVYSEKDIQDIQHLGEQEKKEYHDKKLEKLTVNGSVLNKFVSMQSENMRMEG